MIVDGKSSKEYSGNAGVPQGSILGPTLFLLLSINGLPDDVISDIAIYADTTLSSKCNQESDLWQQLELTSNVEFDLWDTGLGLELAYWFQCWKYQLVSFDHPKNTGAIDVKMDGSVKMLGLTFSSKLLLNPHIISIAKTVSKKIGALIHSRKFLSSEAAQYL